MFRCDGKNRACKSRYEGRACGYFAVSWDYKEVLGRFADGADTPYWYNGHLYAIPDTQSFFIMFVRTDILKNLGLEIPKTWNEFIHAATIIQRNNMNVYLPYTQMGDASSVNGGLGSRICSLRL